MREICTYGSVVGPSQQWLGLPDLPTGNLYAKGSYTQGEKIGLWTFYYPSGKPKFEGQYIEDLRSGEWKSWNEAGELITVLYERGRLI